MTDILIRKAKKTINVGDGILSVEADRFATYGEEGNGEFNGRSFTPEYKRKFQIGYERIFGKPTVNKANGNSNPQKEV